MGPILGGSETQALPTHLVLLLSSPTEKHSVSAGSTGAVPGSEVLSAAYSAGGQGTNPPGASLRLPSSRENTGTCSLAHLSFSPFLKWQALPRDPYDLFPANCLQTLLGIIPWLSCSNPSGEHNNTDNNWQLIMVWDLQTAHLDDPITAGL